MHHRRSETAHRWHRRRRSSHGKYFPGACHPPHRRGSHQGNCFGSAGYLAARRRRSDHRCWASGCRQSAAHRAGSRRRSHSDHCSDRFDHSGRSGNQHCRHSGRRPDYRRWTDCLPAIPVIPAIRPSCCRRTAAACSSRFAHRTNRYGPEKTIASHPGSAWRNPRDRRRPMSRTASRTRSRRMSHPMASTRRSRRKMTIAAAGWGSRPSGMRTLHRLPLLARRPRAEICASAEFASFLLVPPPHTATAAAVAECATGQLNAG
jgi:hypothetical protein